MKALKDRKDEDARAGKKRPGLNEPCWCGSGKKYRHCHLYEDYQKLTHKTPLNCQPT